ncbi:MAG: MopE-related protein [Myxococcota bacterium]
MLSLRLPIRSGLAVLLGPALLLFGALPSGCAPDEYAVLISARSEMDVDELRVVVVPLDGGSTREFPNQDVGRSQEDIEREPIRIGVEVDNPGSYLVHVIALTPGNEVLVGTRCYPVNQVVRDDILLVRLDPSSDADGDGFPADPSASCRGPGDVPCTQFQCPTADCDDANELVNPGAEELCADGIDQNCVMGDMADCQDADGDGFNQCGAMTIGACDCRDGDPAIFPGAEETCGDGIDQDCSGADIGCDDDGDGFPEPEDCDDDNPAVNPMATEDCTNDGEVPTDENCNNLIDEGCTPDDLDGDGFDFTVDCNDCDPGISPGVREICGNAIDEDCSGMADPCPAGDTDMDGFTTSDCAEGDPNANPSESTFDNCATPINETCLPERECTSPDQDPDGDGFREVDSLGAALTCEGDPMVVPLTTETCDGIDQNCNGVTDEVLDRSVNFVNDLGVTENLGPGQSGCVDQALPDTGNCQTDRCVLSFNTNVFHCSGCRVNCNGNDPTAPPVADQCEGGVCNCSAELGTIAPCDRGTNQQCCGAPAGCTNVDIDFESCGSCNRRCADQPECSPTLGISRCDTCGGGNCQCEASGASCAAGQGCCGAAGCVNIMTDPNFCGGCNPCNLRNVQTHSCSGGTCGIVECDPGFDDCDGNPANGCETSLRTNANCGGCGTQCNLPNATATSCSTGSCEVVTCNSQFGNCDGNQPNGCETRLNSLTNCGGCGTPCSLNNATESCASFSCQITACDGGFGDCDGNDGNGCEIQLNTLTNCNGCGMSCSRTNATATCATGMCAIQSCDALRDDCNGVDMDGCEQRLDRVNNCGGCGVVCTLPNTDATRCPGGNCRIMTCSSGFGDCNMMDSDGCEEPLDSPMFCGSCTNQCNLPNANEGCNGGTCEVASCMGGFRNCNGMDADGCEVNLGSPPHCMACRDCTSEPNTTRSCGGGCTYECMPNFGDCDGDLGMGGNGCETPLTNDNNNCGGCGVTCNANQACNGMGQCCCGSTCSSAGESDACGGGTMCNMSGMCV